MKAKWFCKKCIGNREVEILTIPNIGGALCEECKEKADHLVANPESLLNFREAFYFFIQQPVQGDLKTQNTPSAHVN